MIIFCDTNIILEVLEERSNYKFVEEILLSNESSNTLYLSEGSFYTITYLLDKRMRLNGIHEPEKTERVKEALLNILLTFRITDTGVHGFKEVVTCCSFKDLEDGYQYEAARHCGADVLLTINKKDFVSVHNADLLVLTPEEYISKYLRNGIDG